MIEWILHMLLLCLLQQRFVYADRHRHAASEYSHRQQQLVTFADSNATQLEDDYEEIRYISRILQKRDIHSNIELDDPHSPCRNGGILNDGVCQCIHPHKGPQCEDFACVHGVSVGRRYDPHSLFFSKPCICDEGWKGDLCEYQLSDKCGNKGQWIDGACRCIGYFFGNECQFTSRCVHGKIINGRCVCKEDFEGLYCETIICYHGYPDHKNKSASCICPLKYKGLHCNECRQSGPKFEKYPLCTVNLKLHDKRLDPRKHSKAQIKSRLWITLASIITLSVFGILMFVYSALQKRKRKNEYEVRHQELAERTAMLNLAVQNLSKEEVNREANPNEQSRLQRKRSFPMLFKIKSMPGNIFDRRNTST